MWLGLIAYPVVLALAGITAYSVAVAILAGLSQLAHSAFTLARSITRR